MYGPPNKLGYPMGKIRLYMSIIPTVGFGYFIFAASTTLGWFTLVRQLYLILGITIGLVMGMFEARFVLQELSQNSEATVWKPLPVGAVLVCLPFMLVLAVFGAAEYLPFGVYFVLSAIPVYLAMGGWLLSKFEKKNNVRIFGSAFGFKYWTEPVEDFRDRFYHFVRDVADKQPSALWWHIGYSGKFIEHLEERQDIEPLTKKELKELLKVMNRYRKLTLTVLTIILSSAVILSLFILVVASGIVKITAQQFGNIAGPSSGIIFFSALAVVLLGMRKFRKTVSMKLASIDSEKLSSL